MRSGLVEVVDVLRNVEGISFVQFDDRDVVRHNLVQKIVKAYERYNEIIGVNRQLSLKLAETAPVEAVAEPVTVPETAA
jgi:phosphate starvation-inducible PhoH-like protein